ncbi:hypothetical protein U1Q18_018227 [Sarracenia purpurea var. burkii]
MWNSAENLSVRSASFREGGDDEEALRWAALERLPTYKRVRRGIFRNVVGDSKEIDVEELEVQERKVVLDRLVDSVEDDSETFFDRMRRRFDAVDLEFPKIEVRFQNLNVESFVHVGSRALPTIPNFLFNMSEALLRQLRIYQPRRRKLTILDDISGIIRPSRQFGRLDQPEFLNLRVVSKKDQQQYWAVPDSVYQYIPVVKFAEAFRSFHAGRNLSEELNAPFDRCYNHPAALSTSRYGMRKTELLKTNFNWQLLLMKRNSFIYVFKFIQFAFMQFYADVAYTVFQLLFVAAITMTVFFRTKLHHNTIGDGGLYLGALYFAMVIILFNGFTEVSMLVAKLPMLAPVSVILLSAPNVFSSFSGDGLLGSEIRCHVYPSFILTDRISKGWIWGFWISPLMYAQNAASVNEFLGHSWDKLLFMKRGGEVIYAGPLGPKSCKLVEYFEVEICLLTTTDICVLHLVNG